jgi:hypothetical protein
MKRASDQPICVICGTAKNIEQNHAGGRNHIAWFKVPFCEEHHRKFHRQLESVGINLTYTPNKLKRLVRAALALTIALWLVLQALATAVEIVPSKDDTT